jgi:DNA processing protein
VEALRTLRREEAVTIVGSRRASAYGLEVARELGRLLGSSGLTVVSGMAFGIDSAAHEGALEAGARTVVVLAGGPDVPYPPSARSLYRRVLKAGGLVLAEHPGGTRPAKWDFPARNRIMAALAEMTIVVEAAEPSGSLITAREATDLHRSVGAVPGPVSSRTSAGTNGLIRDGAALIRDAQDVLDELLGVGIASVRREGPALDEGLRAALASLEQGSSGVDDLARTCGLSAADAAVALARLELMGYLRASADSTFTRTSLAPP